MKTYRMIKTVLVTLTLAILLVGTAEAVIIVDLDAFPNETDISNAFPGLALLALGDYSGADGKVYALTDGLASTGTKIFGNSWTYDGWGFYTSFQPHLRVDFDAPVMSVTIDAIGDDNEDYGRLEAYSSTSVLIEAYETGPLQFGDVETMSVSRASAQIAYILVAGKEEPGFAPNHTVHLDNLNYVVPEPATFALLGLSSLVLLYKRRDNRLPAAKKTTTSALHHRV